MNRSATSLVVALALACSTTGCFRGVGHLFNAMAWTAIMTTAIVSSERPPEPVIVYAPQPHAGYTWQPGYWTRADGDWEWVEGNWVPNYPGYRWSPTHWVSDPNGRWRLVPGRWIAVPPMAAVPQSTPPEETPEGLPPEPPPPPSLDQ